MRDDLGYTDDWYDVIDADDGEYVFAFQVPNDGQVIEVEDTAETGTFADYLFITVETYYAQVVPSTCSHGLADIYGY